MHCKYVVMNFTEPMGLENETMFIFPEYVTHKGFVLSLKRHWIDDHVISAGFILVGKDQNGDVRATAYGKSTTLNIESREQDSRLARRTLGITV